MIRLLILSSLLLIAACDVSGGLAADAEYTASVEGWRSERRARLMADDGYLNLAGLFWLDDGSFRFGAAADNDIVFPAGADYIGRFEVAAGRVHMYVNDAVDVHVDGRVVGDAPLSDDTSEDYATASHGSLTWVVINRDGKVAIRLRDLEHPALEALPPLPYFDIDRDWRITGTLRRYDQPRTIAVGTVIDWLGWHPESPGVVEFEVGDERFSLEAYTSGDRLFFVFADRTSGRETYPAGRFLYAEMPGADGETVLDFNRAYNPPCAFNDFSTCPIASPKNRLGIAVTAGEKYSDAIYFGS